MYEAVCTTCEAAEVTVCAMCRSCGERQEYHCLHCDTCFCNTCEMWELRELPVTRRTQIWRLLRGVARAVGRLMVLHRRTLERMYAPGGSGYVQAALSFGAAVAQASTDVRGDPRFQIQYRDLQGHHGTLNGVRAADSAGVVLRRIATKTDVSEEMAAALRLMKAGRAMDLCAPCGLVKGETVHVVGRLDGGGGSGSERVGEWKEEGETWFHRHYPSHPVHAPRSLGKGARRTRLYRALQRLDAETSVVQTHPLQPTPPPTVTRHPRGGGGPGSDEAAVRHADCAAFRELFVQGGWGRALVCADKRASTRRLECSPLGYVLHRHDELVLAGAGCLVQEPDVSCMFWHEALQVAAGARVWLSTQERSRVDALMKSTWELGLHLGREALAGSLATADSVLRNACSPLRLLSQGCDDVAHDVAHAHDEVFEWTTLFALAQGVHLVLALGCDGTGRFVVYDAWRNLLIAPSHHPILVPPPRPCTVLCQIHWHALRVQPAAVGDEQRTRTLLRHLLRLESPLRARKLVVAVRDVARVTTFNTPWHYGGPHPCRAEDRHSLHFTAAQAAGFRRARVRHFWRVLLVKLRFAYFLCELLQQIQARQPTDESEGGGGGGGGGGEGCGEGGGECGGGEGGSEGDGDEGGGGEGGSGEDGSRLQLRLSMEALRLPMEQVRLPMEALTLANALGRDVLVPRAMWPDYPCEECGGEGWLAQVVRVRVCTRGVAALVEFRHVCDEHGRRFANEWLELCLLEPRSRARVARGCPFALPTSAIGVVAAAPNTPVGETTDGASALCELERRRLACMERNKCMLRQLGLLSAPPASKPLAPRRMRLVEMRERRRSARLIAQPTPSYVQTRAYKKRTIEASACTDARAVPLPRLRGGGDSRKASGSVQPAAPPRMLRPARGRGVPYVVTDHAPTGRRWWWTRTVVWRRAAGGDQPWHAPVHLSTVLSDGFLRGTRLPVIAYYRWCDGGWVLWLVACESVRLWKASPPVRGQMGLYCARRGGLGRSGTVDVESGRYRRQADVITCAEGTSAGVFPRGSPQFRRAVRRLSARSSYVLQLDPVEQGCGGVELVDCDTHGEGLRYANDARTLPFEDNATLSPEGVLYPIGEPIPPLCASRGEQMAESEITWR